jgi:LacI family transcriptional regulator
MSSQRTTSTVTLQTIADRCGVTKVTVSRALNGNLQHVNKATMERIKTVASELGYNPGANHDARRLAMRKGTQPILNHTVGFLLSERFYETNYYQTLLQGALEVLAPKHYGLLLGYMYQNIQLADLPYAFRRDQLDAILTCRPESEMKPLLKELFVQRNFTRRPMVSMVYRIPGCSSVIPDHQMAGYLLARHLILQGHRHMLHFAPDDFPLLHPLDLCLAGYRQAYREAGLNPDLYLEYMPYPYSQQLQCDDLYSYAREVLNKLDKCAKITAVLAPYDKFAGILIEILSKHGRRVPEDISVVGLDNTDPVLNQHGENILTTIQMPLIEIGRQAAGLALRQISHEESENVTVLLPVKLVERASTCPPRSVQT